MKVYEIELRISWLGGIATVIADTKEEALQLCRDYYYKTQEYQEFNNEFGWEIINEKPLVKGVVQFWDGDY